MLTLPITVYELVLFGPLAALSMVTVGWAVASGADAAKEVPGWLQNLRSQPKLRSTEAAALGLRAVRDPRLWVPVLVFLALTAIVRVRPATPPSAYTAYVQSRHPS